MEAKRLLRSDLWGIWGIRILFLFYLGLGALGFLRLLTAINQPFGGFVWQRSDPRGFTVSWETGQGWAGRQAGLALDDLILRIQGQEIPLTGQPDVIGATYGDAEIGQLVDYEIERQGQTLHIQAPVTRFTWRHLLESFFPFYMASLAAWSIGLFVHLVSPREQTSKVFTLLCLALSVTFGVHSFTGFVHKFYYAHWSISILYGSAWSLLNALSVHFFSIVPERRTWWPRIRLWVYGIAISIGLASSLANALWSASVWKAASWINPTLIATVVCSVVAAIYDIAVATSAYRRSPSPRARQQIRVVGLGLILGLLIPFLSTSTYIFFRPYPGIWWSPAELVGVRLVSDWLLPLPLQVMITATVLPAFVAVALLRYEAFGAKPALVKAATTALLAGAWVLIYTLMANGLQIVFDRLGIDFLILSLIGERFNRMWLSGVLATVLMALLYTPLRDRIDQWITHLLYPYRISSDEALQILIETMQQVDRTHKVEAEKVPQLLTVVLREMLHVDDAFLWFYFPATRELQLAGRHDVQPARLFLEQKVFQRLIHTSPPLHLSAEQALAPLATALASLEIQVCLPLVMGRRELVGLVGLGPRRDEVPFGLEDRQLLSHLAEYLLLLLHNVRTIRALEQSRERISLVQERERKSIARDLHDGPLQDLSYLTTVKLELCKQAVADPGQAARLIQEAQVDAGWAISQLRGMLSDISPDVIARRGLVSALESLVTRARSDAVGQDVEIVLHVKGYTNRMLPEPHELALFRFVQEALRNALQHAGARRIDIRLTCAAERLIIAVQDNGRGFDTDQQSEFLRQGHLGLQSMQDRISSLHGELTLESSPGLGTSVWVEIPLRPDISEAD